MPQARVELEQLRENRWVGEVEVGGRIAALRKGIHTNGAMEMLAKTAEALGFLVEHVVQVEKEGEEYYAEFKVKDPQWHVEKHHGKEEARKEEHKKEGAHGKAKRQQDPYESSEGSDEGQAQ